MTNFTIKGITPFLPAKDYALSLRFYNDLGFSEIDKNEKAIYFKISKFGFWLQDYYIEDWANNCMLCLYVDDLASWWQRIQTMEFEKNYNKQAKVLSPPHEQEGAYMLQIADPSSVLWHFRQNP